MKYRNIFYVLLVMLTLYARAQETIPLDLVMEDPEDLEVLKEELNEEQKIKKDRQVYETEKELDDLDALKEDLGDIEFIIDDKREKQVIRNIEKPDEVKAKVDTEKANPEIVDINAMDGKDSFDVGAEEQELLSIAEKMQGQIPESEWNEVTTAGGVTSYTVIKNDWLWKISSKIFGSGFYYPKIWSLNPFITNPHEIEPGMVLNFTTGHQDALPQFSIGGKKIKVTKLKKETEYDKFGDNAMPSWMETRKGLKGDGTYFQYASAETDDDLKEAAKYGLNKEYETYRPPRPDFLFQGNTEEYDEAGFSKSSKEFVDFKQGFYLNTFVTTNIVQDFGKIAAGIEEKKFFATFDKVYLHFDENVNVMVGDKFSIYQSRGEVNHENSDRKGHQYVISGSVQVVQKIDDVWECDIIEAVDLIKREDRITVYTPKIERITKTFNSRTIEAVLIGAFERDKRNVSLGDVVYLDRGRADGVEQGNVFEMYGFKDRATLKNITENPTYKNGEVTVITVTDNFATALVTSSIRDFFVGDVAITKSLNDAARESKLRNRLAKTEGATLKGEALDELDVELNVDDLADDLLKKADRIEFTDDELAELERQEREKSILTESERDLKALERLEGEIDSAERLMNEARLDEDKLLEDESLDSLEKKLLYDEQEGLDEMEENFGKRYLDENLNDKDNPYGLTELDIEEIDELLNMDKVENQGENTSENIDLLE